MAGRGGVGAGRGVGRGAERGLGRSPYTGVTEARRLEVQAARVSNTSLGSEEDRRGLGRGQAPGVYPLPIPSLLREWLEGRGRGRPAAQLSMHTQLVSLAAICFSVRCVPSMIAWLT